MALGLFGDDPVETEADLAYLQDASLVVLTRAYAELARSAHGRGRIAPDVARTVVACTRQRGPFRVASSGSGFVVGVTPEVAVGVFAEDGREAWEAAQGAVTDAFAPSQFAP